MIKNWTREVYSRKDYIAWEKEISEARNSFWDEKIQFNQNDIDKSWCVYHSWTWCIADQEIFKYENFLNDVEWRKYKYWYMDWKWMYIYRWVDLVRDTWNWQNPDDTIITERVKNWSTEFYETLKKGYSIHTWYRWNSKYNEDRNDWVLDWNEFGETTYWHSIRITKKDGLYVVDNYLWRDSNIYEIEDLKWLLQNDVFFNNWYIYIFKNEIMKNPDVALIEKAINEWITKQESLLQDVKDWNYHSELRNLIRLMRVKKDLEKQIKSV